MGFLQLNRRVGQRIRINDDIVIVVAGIRGSTVKVAIDAPADVRINREEVYQAKESSDGQPTAE